MYTEADNYKTDMTTKNIRQKTKPCPICKRKAFIEGEECANFCYSHIYISCDHKDGCMLEFTQFEGCSVDSVRRKWIGRR